MKILLVHPQMSFYGGAETVVIHLANELRNSGQNVSILTLSVCDEVRRACADIPFYLPPEPVMPALHHKNLADGIADFMKQIFLLRDLIKIHLSKADVVHIHNFPATWACALAGVRDAVWMCNEPPDSWNTLSRSPLHALLNSVGAHIDGYLVRRTAKRICGADRINADRIKKRYRHRVDIVPYGIDFDFFSRPPVDRQSILHKYGLSGHFVITQVGTVTVQKNQLESIKALFSVKKVFAQTCLVLAGPENQDYRRELDSFIDAHGLKDSVFFLGPLARKDIVELYHVSDLALFPVKTQGGWLAPFEALCAGTPVIVSETMGASDLIKTHDLGIVTNDYAEAVMEIYQNRKSYAEKARISREWVEKNLTWENFAKENLRIFTEVYRDKKGVV
ncbi:glycosyltransferase [Candidatus Velamenicoccus archaeovorus]|uniref:Glycosyltransferase n=1 Tax=Velamenicoccus archaeovorus TaxID=1930593 RepID=A0A410P4C3_VELA1|nr:glycosyltransferase family 4 protein [Candidatus Velamenicoccus archaeovorus]QAT17016.1 glycosyltransferase [Candidatus Velamenicoccus archaeovorus]